MAKECPNPAEASFQFVSELTCTGMLLLHEVPSPKQPDKLKPQTHKVPSVFIPKQWLFPAEIDSQSAACPTCLGTIWSAWVPMPNWPTSLRPQAHKVPSVFNPRLKELLAEIWLQH